MAGAQQKYFDVFWGFEQSGERSQFSVTLLKFGPDKCHLVSAYHAMDGKRNIFWVRHPVSGFTYETRVVAFNGDIDVALLESPEWIEAEGYCDSLATLPDEPVTHEGVRMALYSGMKAGREPAITLFRGTSVSKINMRLHVGHPEVEVLSVPALTMFPRESGGLMVDRRTGQPIALNLKFATQNRSGAIGIPISTLRQFVSGPNILAQVPMGLDERLPREYDKSGTNLHADGSLGSSPSNRGGAARHLFQEFSLASLEGYALEDNTVVHAVNGFQVTGYDSFSKLVERYPDGPFVESDLHVLDFQTRAHIFERLSGIYSPGSNEFSLIRSFDVSKGDFSVTEQSGGSLLAQDMVEVYEPSPGNWMVSLIFMKPSTQAELLFSRNWLAASYTETENIPNSFPITRRTPRVNYQVEMSPNAKQITLIPDLGSFPTLVCANNFYSQLICYDEDKDQATLQLSFDQLNSRAHFVWAVTDLSPRSDFVKINTRYSVLDYQEVL